MRSTGVDVVERVRPAPMRDEHMVALPVDRKVIEPAASGEVVSHHDRQWMMRVSCSCRTELSA
jgi:hypothetical protein